MKKTPRVDVVNGNMAAAIGARLCHPDVIAAYPITPQTPIVEYLTKFVADGEMDASLCEVESEHSALSVLHGASLAGGRTFTATSSQGLSLMYEPYFRTSTLRLPIVMAIANREMISPQTVWGGPQDALTLRDAGWIQIYVEDNQELLDTVIQAFRIAEDARVLLPVNVCYEGFYLSHMTERVEIPDQDDVDAYLPSYRPEHIYLDPERPMSVDPLTPGNLLTGYRQKHQQGMREALALIEEVDESYRQLFGRSYSGLVEEYRTEGARHIIVTQGSSTGAAREAVDIEREKGIPVGLLKVRVMRPFPWQRIARALAGKQSFGVVDRSVSFGWDCGILYPEVCAAVHRSGNLIPGQGFIGGLGGEDLTIDLMVKAIEEIVQLSKSAASCGEKAKWLVRE